MAPPPTRRDALCVMVFATAALAGCPPGDRDGVIRVGCVGDSNDAKWPRPYGLDLTRYDTLHLDDASQQTLAARVVARVGGYS